MAEWDIITQTLEHLGCPYRENEPLSDHTSFHIGGPCSIMAFPRRDEEIAALIKACIKGNIPYYILGKGSNVLAPDEGVEGLILLLDQHFSDVIVTPEGQMICQAGASLSKVCRVALEHSLTGLEFAWGIPGSIGGAAYMNAGAYGGEMKDVLISCRHLDEKGNAGEYEKEELCLSYRHSVYSDKTYCITSVVLQLKPGDPAAIREKMDELMGRRKEKQPLEFPSAGSTFKRPQGNYASALIDQCGLRGKQVGGAMVSEKHCGFVINAGGATCRDVLELIEQIKQIVLQKTGYRLECEVKMLQPWKPCET